MSRPIAKQGDRVVGTDTHVILVPSGGGPVPTPMPLPFSGPLTEALCDTVLAEHRAVAVVGSGAINMPVHAPPVGTFQSPPSNRAKIIVGSATVLAERKQVARLNDSANCCNDPADAPTGHVVSSGTVLVL